MNNNTTIEQSKKLLELGIKPETADMKQIKFNYSIGDTVTLIQEPDYKNRQYLSYRNTPFQPKEYKIRKIRYTVNDKEQENILYQLDAYMDEYLNYHNWLTEDYIQGQGTEHLENVDFVSVDGEQLHIGDHIYNDIYYGNSNNWYLAPGFTFTSYGKIISLTCTWEEAIYSDGGKTIYQIKEGNALAEKYWIKNSINTNFTFFIINALKNPGDKFVEDYIKACKKNRFNPFGDKVHPDEIKRVKEWLTFMGVYDQVKNNYDKITTKKKKTTVKKDSTKDSTIDNIISQLNDKQKKELLKKLKNKYE